MPTGAPAAAALRDRVGRQVGVGRRVEGDRLRAVEDGQREQPGGGAGVRGGGGDRQVTVGSVSESSVPVAARVMTPEVESMAKRGSSIV